MDRTKPNVLLAFPEDWGRFASAYARFDRPGSLNELLSTPNFDAVAAKGVLFLNARADAPGCNPCRSSLMSGRRFWQTGLGAIEQGTVWDEAIPTFPLELEKSGYFLGYTYEGDFGKTNARIGGSRTAYNTAGHNFGDFSRRVARAAPTAGEEAAKEALLAEVRANLRSFLDARASQAPGRPFCYIWGPTTTHRGAGWEPGSGKSLWGIDPHGLKGRLPAFLPDVAAVREDVADYLGECCAMDRGLGVVLDELESCGELSHTLVLVCGDHGMPGIPRAKACQYDFGCQVALAACWPGRIPPGRHVEDFVSLMELAPTVLEAAGITVPPGMTARSLLGILECPRSGQVGDADDFAGDTMLVFPDCDASPAKAWLIRHRREPGCDLCFRLAFGRRPREELYDVREDPDSMTNLAGEPAFAARLVELRERLLTVLRVDGDPRVVERPCRYELAPYASQIAKYETPEGKAMLQRLDDARRQWLRWGARL